MMSKDTSMLREVKVEDAIGMILPHDLTQILPGEFKGRLFRKGHQVTEADIPALLSIGKEHIYVMELQPGYLHEDEAALRMARAIVGADASVGASANANASASASASASANLKLTEPHEGKVNVKTEIHGLVKIDKAFVDSVNAIDEVVLSTIRSNTVVQAGASLVGTRVIPLIVNEAKVLEVERLAAARRAEGFTLLEVKPFRALRVGVITTGSEVFKGRIADKFGPIVKEKVAQLGSQVVDQRFVSDDSEAIVSEIHALVALGVDLVLVTGGMSVDPDDRTPGAIKAAGARVVSYGTPMLPGSMLMIAYLGDLPIMGLPGCVMHDPYTSFDVLLPRICAGEEIVRSDITEMGYGGFYQC